MNSLHYPPSVDMSYYDSLKILTTRNILVSFGLNPTLLIVSLRDYRSFEDSDTLRKNLQNIIIYLSCIYLCDIMKLKYTRRFSLNDVGKFAVFFICIKIEFYLKEKITNVPPNDLFYNDYIFFE